MTTENLQQYAEQLTLCERVEQQLQRDGRLRRCHFHVQEIRGNIYLGGYVSRYSDSIIAEQVTKQIPGVQAVTNEVLVR